ncbi:1-acyl-sn-glycerol-3-phosphate acyltransferase [Mycolicibacterium thermoresistibile]
MGSTDEGDSQVAKWDPAFTERLVGMLTPMVKRYFRAEVRGLDRFPEGAALLVSNHSGGMFTMDVPIFATAFYRHFGYARPVYTLAHYGVFLGNIGNWLIRAGVIGASRENAAEALRSGGVVVVFPGGDYDSYRSTFSANTIDFEGRTGYVRAAIEAGVPIVPAVSIGGQESQLFLIRGDRLARMIGLDRVRMKILPLTFGLPFGLTSVLPPNLPLPSKVVTEVLEPIDIEDRFGPDPDVAEVDAHVRAVMQQTLDRLSAERRFPVLG